MRRNPVFRNFVFAVTVSMLGTNIFDIAIPLYVLQRTQSATMLAIVTFFMHLPYFLMAPLTGYSADHADKRRMMLIADSGQVFCLTFLLAYELTSAENIWPILVTVFFTKSLMIIFESITTFQLIPALVGPEDLSSANTWFLGLQRSLQVIGPITGGVLMGFAGIRFCILLNILSFAATLYFTYKLVDLNALFPEDDQQRKPMTVGNMVDNFLESMRFTWTSPIFRPFIFLMFFWNLSSLVPNTPSITYYFTALNHFSPARYGLVVALFGVLGVVGYFGAARFYRRYDFHRTFVGSCYWQAVLGSVALCFYGYPIVLATVFGISRMGSSVLTMGTFFLRQTKVPRARIGGVNACIRMFFMSAAPLSSLMQAVLINYFGVHASFVAGAISLWAAAWYANKVALAATQGTLRPTGQDAAA